MKKVVEGLGGLLLGVAGLVVFGALLAGWIWGVEWVSGHLVGPALQLCSWTLVICLLILTPLAFFRGTRIAALYGFFAASYIFGATTWMVAFLTALFYWGAVGVIVGLFLAGIGVAPVAILASIVNSDWTGAGLLALGCALTLGCRMLAFWVANMQDRAEQKRTEKLVVLAAPYFD